MRLRAPDNHSGRIRESRPVVLALNEGRPVREREHGQTDAREQECCSRDRLRRMPCKRKRGQADGNRQVPSCSLEHARNRVKRARSSNCGNEGDEKGQCEEHPTCPPPLCECVDVRDSASEGKRDSRQRP